MDKESYPGKPPLLSYLGEYRDESVDKAIDSIKEF